MPLRLRYRLGVAREAAANETVSRIPVLRARMLAYQTLGITFEDRATSTILMHTNVHSPERIKVGAHSIIGRFCLVDGRGGITIGRNVNITSYTLLVTERTRSTATGSRRRSRRSPSRTMPGSRLA